MMYEREKSDSSIVAVKPTNKAGQPVAEPVEPREGTERNVDQQSTHRTQRRDRVSQALARVRQAAGRDKTLRLTALLHHVTIDLLGESFDALKRTAAPGVDGVTWHAYAQDLEGNLAALHERVHRGAYRAQPSRRQYIPKPDGRQRPLGIAALEDKIVQRAVMTVLNQIYEGDFLRFSYGFRPGSSQHDALDALIVGISRRKIGWVLDADIKGFFDSINHDWLIRFVEYRVGDPGVLRLIRKWLTAGVLEDGLITHPEEGSPQGAVISPLLANIFLHYVLDLWVHQWRGRHAHGDVLIVRYADDFVVGFEYRFEAERFLSELTDRLARYGLELHPNKTRLLEFGRFAASNRSKRGEGKPETFQFLGFTLICGKSRKGKFLVLRKTRTDRLWAKLADIKDKLLQRRHLSVADIGRWLGRVVAGYFNYHAVPTNSRALSAFRFHVTRLWLYALRRRSQRDRTTWTDITRLAKQWLPKPNIRHPWPNQRFDAKYAR